MGDDNNYLVVFVGEVAEDFDDFFLGVFVEITGGLVGHDDGRIGGEGASDGDTLLLTAGELADEAPTFFRSDADFFEVLIRVGFAVVEIGGDFNVFGGGHVFDEVVALKYDIDVFEAVFLASDFSQAFAVVFDVAVLEFVESGEEA